MALISDELPLIIGHVDDMATLHSLLTVSKQVFVCACRVLYRDPFLSFCKITSRDSSQRRRLPCLIRLLLSLSPATDDDANLVRTAYGLQAKHPSNMGTVPTMMLDYLSFVQVVRWESILKDTLSQEDMRVFEEWNSPNGGEQSLYSFIRSTLTWCFCGHQLGRMRELQIEPAVIERYIAVASQLKRLRIVVIAAFYGDERESEWGQPPASPYPAVVRFIQAHHQYHGKDLLQDCRFTPRTYGTLSPKNLQWDIDIRKLLPIALPGDLKLVMPIRPMDSYLSRITFLMTTMDNYSPWKIVASQYLDMSFGQVLQRCRALVRLNLGFFEGGIADPGILGWAADEARERAAGKLLTPAVALEGLGLFFDLGTNVDVTRTLIDGLRGFASSLENLVMHASLPGVELDSPRILRLEDGFFQDKPVMLRRLHSLTFLSDGPGQCDYRLLQLCPNLTYLCLSENNSKMSSTSASSWPVVKLPMLTYLELRGSAAVSFNPASLHGMQKLRSLCIAFRHRLLCNTVLRSRAFSSFHCPLNRVTLPDCWTWDWDLLELTNLDVWWYSSENMFSLRVLQNFPKLESLRYTSEMPIDGVPHLLDVLTVLPSSTEDIFPNLHRIDLSSGFRVEPEHLSVLLKRALPGLKWLYLNKLSLCDVQQIIELARHHPSLSWVSLQHTPLTYAEVETLNLEETNTGCAGAGYCQIVLSRVEGRIRYLWLRKLQ